MFIRLNDKAFIYLFIAERGKKCLDESTITPRYLYFGSSYIDTPSIT